MAKGELPVVKEEVEEPLSPVARVFQQPGFDSYIIAVMGIGQKINVDVFKAGIESSFILHPRFSSIPVSDGNGPNKPRWVRTKVVVEDHLMIPDMDPGFTTPDQLVEDYLSSLSTTNLDFSRPLWDFHILNIRTTDAEATAILRVHHSLGDGISFLSLLLACTRKSSDPNSLPTVPKSCPLAPGKKHRLWAFLLQFWEVVILLWHTLVDMLLFTATTTLLHDTNTPLKGTKGAEFRQKRIVHRIVSLDEVKTIKNVMGCTVNDVLLEATSAGLSRYLSRSFREHNGGKDLPANIRIRTTLVVNIRPALGIHTVNDVLLGVTSAGLSRYLSRSFREHNGGKDLPANIRVRTTLVVNIRPALGIHTMLEMITGESSGARWGNCLGYVIMPIPILMCKDPLDYIRKGKAIADRKKSSLEAFISNKSAFWVVKLFGIKAATTLCHRVLSHTTLSFSSLIGPIEEVSLFGHPLIYVAPSSYGHPQAIALHFKSYMKKLTMVATVDELNIPDPHQLLDDLAESLKLIKDAAVGFPIDGLLADNHKTIEV